MTAWEDRVRWCRSFLSTVAGALMALVWTWLWFSTAAFVGQDLYGAAVKDFGDGFFAKLFLYAVIGAGLWVWFRVLVLIVRFCWEALCTVSAVENFLEVFDELREAAGERFGRWKSHRRSSGTRP